jgi:hypothetical protein
MIAFGTSAKNSPVAVQKPFLAAGSVGFSSGAAATAAADCEPDLVSNNKNIYQ